MVQKTLVSGILNRLKRSQALSRAEDGDLIRDLDEQIREWRRENLFPWVIQRSSLKVFADVLEYPVPSGFDELALLENDKADSFYPASARFRFTSLEQFYQNPDYRNDLAEIRDGNDRFLGVRYFPTNVVSQTLNGAELASDYSVSGDATAKALDNVVVKRGNGSIKVTITNSAGTATVKNTFDSFTDGNYKQKWHFKWVYLDAVPTSITLRFQVSDTVYIETTGITTQFSGQPLVADTWNLVAHDLNEASEVGSISTASLWASEKIILIGAATGTYYVDESNLRQWQLLDFWYYSKNQVALIGSETANQEYIRNSSDVYSSDSSIIGDSEWIDVIMFGAKIKALTDLKEFKLADAARIDFNNSILALETKYPDMVPIITTLKYRITTDFTQAYEEDIA